MYIWLQLSMETWLVTVRSYIVLMELFNGYFPRSNCRVRSIYEFSIFFLRLQFITTIPICEDPPLLLQTPQNLTESRWMKKYFPLVEGFAAVFYYTSRFSKSILLLKEQKYAILVTLVISKAAKDHIISLLINDLYNHRNEWNQFAPPRSIRYPLLKTFFKLLYPLIKINPGIYSSIGYF